MSNHKDIIDGIDFSRKSSRKISNPAEGIHQAIMQEHHFRRAGEKRAKNLVSLLMSHGARLRRSIAPRTKIRMRVVSPQGKLSVLLQL